MKKRIGWMVLGAALAGLILVLLPPKAEAQQTTLERCKQGACYGFGPPIGSCVGAFIYSDISQTPVVQYACNAKAWTRAGGTPNAGANLFVYGDSHPSGAGLAAAFMNYPSILAFNRNWSLTNNAVAGAQFTDE